MDEELKNKYTRFSKYSEDVDTEVDGYWIVMNFFFLNSKKVLNDEYVALEVDLETKARNIYLKLFKEKKLSGVIKFDDQYNIVE